MPNVRSCRASAAWVSVSMACETSVSRLPGTIAAIPASIASRVACESASSTGISAPTPKVTAESPCQSSRIAPQSIDTRSPAASFSLAAGMPCTTRSFTDEQILAGKP
jgi:hypothetical protein